MKSGFKKLIYTWNYTALSLFCLAIILLKYDMNMKEFAIFVLFSSFKLCETCKFTKSSSRPSPVMFTVSQITIVTTLNYLHKMVSSLAFSSAKFFCLSLRACLLTGQECYPSIHCHESNLPERKLE